MMIMMLLLIILLQYFIIILSLSINESSIPLLSCCRSSSSILPSCLSIWSLNDQIKQQSNRKNKKNIALITYITENIIDYAVYSLAINAIYAEYHDYNYYIMSPLSNSEYEPRDQRWNRVKIIENAIDPHDGFLNDMDYIVWIDADLVFINLEYSLTDIINDNSNADIIISSEWHAETGVANTGCFIAKNNDWTRNFLSMWWNNYDRSLNHDQIFFDNLYKALYPGIRSHVAIIPPAALNSIPPPMKYQQSHHSVLHMMGESSRLRKAVFQRGWDGICSSPQSIPNQLNLSQPILQSLALQIFYDRLNEIIVNVNNTSASITNDGIDNNDSSRQSIDSVYNSISEGRQIILQIKILNDDKNDKNLKNILITMYTTMNHIYLRLVEHQHLYPVDSYKYLEIQVLNLYAIIGNDLSNELDNNNDTDIKRDLLYEIKQSLERLQILVSKSSSIIIKEMLGMHLHSIGQFELSNNNSDVALDNYNSSVAIFKEIIPQGGNIYHSITPIISFGWELCSNQNEVDGLYELLSLIDHLQQQILFAEEQHKNDHKHLIEAMIKAGLCLFSLLEKSSSSFALLETKKASLMRMIQYVTIYSTALLSSSSKYKDNSQKLSHLNTLSLLLNQKYEYISSTIHSIDNNINDKPTNSLLGTFKTIIIKKNEKKTIKFLKKRKH